VKGEPTSWSGYLEHNEDRELENEFVREGVGWRKEMMEGTGGRGEQPASQLFSFSWEITCVRVLSLFFDCESQSQFNLESNYTHVHIAHLKSLICESACMKDYVMSCVCIERMPAGQTLKNENGDTSVPVPTD
jgi:hypothetical protein